MKQAFIFGIQAILESIQAGISVSKIFITPGYAQGNRKRLFEKAQAHNIPLSQVPLAKLRRMTKKNHQGAIAWIAPIPFVPIDFSIEKAYEAGRLPLIVALDGVQDVRNMGAIARSAESIGADGLLLSAQKSAPIHADAVKASSGALMHINVSRTYQLADTLASLKAYGLKVVVCSGASTSESLYKTPLTGGVVLVLGNEEKGVSASIESIADLRVKISMKGHIASLNVGAAAAIFIYEVMRQRAQQSPPNA